MKKLVAVVLTVLVLAKAQAQSPRIVVFSADGTLVWTNTSPTGVSAIQWKPDVAWEWLPLSQDLWNFPVTSTYMVATQVLHSEYLAVVSGMMQNLSWQFPNLANKDHQGFLRVVWATNVIPDLTLIESLRIQNLSEQAISNVEIRLQSGGDSSLLTNTIALASGDSTDYQTATQEISLATTISIIAQYPPPEVFWGWKLRYATQGTNFEYGLSFMPIGPAGKKTTVIVSNAITSIWYEWLGPPIELRTFP